ncbi:MAG: response regulator transcription factor [Nitrospinae bacterium]|nr:response regulator transcription factor [Nitrospinota bacterium]
MGKINYHDKSADKKGLIRAVIADDHPVIIEGLRMFFREGNVIVVATAADGAEALKAIVEHKPDVALLDLFMPGMGAIDVIKVLHKTENSTKVLVLTATLDEEYLDEALDLGVSGYLLKDSVLDQVQEAILLAMDDKIYISPLLDKRLSKGKKSSKAAIDQKLALLSPAEKTVLSSLAERRTNKGVAAHLKISEKTVKNHRANICEKLGLTGSHALLEFAVRNSGSL